MAGIISDVFAPITEVFSMITNTESLMTFIETKFIDVKTSILTAENAEYAFIVSAFAAAELKAVTDLVQGTWKMFLGTLNVIPKIGDHLGDGIYAIFTFAITWIMCLFKNLSNFQVCGFYYVLEIIGQILYLPVRIFLWIAYKFGIDIYPMETKFWNTIEIVDSYSMRYLTFHISHYPKNIREKCYTCKRLKVSSLVNHSLPLVDVLVDDVPKQLVPGIMQIVKGAEELTHPFDYADL
jgi:hypothetical protein